MTNEFVEVRRGRDTVDIDSELVTYVRTELAKGRSMTEIGKSGLVIYNQCPSAGGPVAVRWPGGKHLERMFRALEDAHTPVWLRKDYVGGEIMFMGRPIPTPVGLAELGTRRAGRPKKSR